MSTTTTVTGGKTAALNDDFEIVKITEDLYDETIQLYQQYFMKYEVVSIATNLLGSQQSIDEMEMLIREILKDGISFAARNRKTNELVAMSVNKMLCPATKISLDEVFSKFSSPQMASVGQYLERMEGTYDIFKEWHIDAAVEIVFLSTRADYGGRGIASWMAKYSIEFARSLNAGTLPPDFVLPAELRDVKPKAICAVFTGHFSQRVGERVGFKTLNKVSNSEFSYEGKSFAEKIDPIHTHAVFAAIQF